MKTSRFFITLSLTVMLVLSLTACGGEKNMDESSEMSDSNTEMSDMKFDSQAEISDEELLTAIEDLVDLLKRMETMDESEVLGAMDEMFALVAKTQNVEAERVELLLETRPELKAAIEGLDSQLAQ